MARLRFATFLPLILLAITAGAVVAAGDAKPGAAWAVEFKDGKTEVLVGHSTAVPKKAKAKDDRQSSLL